LKQNEIEQALSQYVASQGIATEDKVITIAFTAGRKESGLTAEVNITATETTPPHRVSVTRTVAAVATPLPQLAAVEPVVEPAADAPAETQEPVKVSSLFA
jgi:hypothetical protein